VSGRGDMTLSGKTLAIRSRGLRRLPWTSWAGDGLYGVLLLVAGLRALTALEQVFDIGLFDETRYLMRGLHLHWADLPHLYRAPLYAVWYAALARLEPDPLALYDLNLRVQALLLPLLFYALLRGMKWPRPAAFVLAWFFLLSDANLLPWPRASSFAWLVLLAGLGLYLRLADGLTARAVLLTALWLSAFARPEMLLAFGLSLAEMGWFLWRRRPPRPRVRRSIIGLAALAGLTIALMGSPLREGGRLKAAFLQHFAYRWNAHYGMSGGTWSRWRETGERVFGTDDSLMRLILGNPDAFARHVATNLAEAGPKAAMLMFFHAPLSGPVWTEGLLAALLWLGLAVGGGWRGGRPARRLVWAAAVLSLPGLASALVIYPRRHYLLGPVLMLWLVWTATVRGGLARRTAKAHGPGLTGGLGLALALALVTLTPRVDARFPCPVEAPRLAGAPLPRYQQWLCRTTDTRQAIVALREAAAQRPTLTVAIDPNFWDENLEVYLPPTVQRTHPAPGTPEKLRILPVDGIVLPYGRPWLDREPYRAALRDVARQGGTVVCTSGRPWILAFRVPVSVPLAPCP